MVLNSAHTLLKVISESFPDKEESRTLDPVVTVSNSPL